jgi:hypothetical protein
MHRAEHLSNQTAPPTIAKNRNPPRSRERSPRLVPHSDDSDGNVDEDHEATQKASGLCYRRLLTVHLRACSEKSMRAADDLEHRVVFVRETGQSTQVT